jgi:hypothetical protein
METLPHVDRGTCANHIVMWCPLFVTCFLLLEKKLSKVTGCHVAGSDISVERAVINVNLHQAWLTALATETSNTASRDFG